MQIKNKDHLNYDELTEKIKRLKLKFENISEQGIVFKINKEKDPSEIIGVLNFLKYKIEEWNNTDIFSYSGNLFGGETIIVVGASKLEDSINMMIYVFLSEVLKNRIQFDLSEAKLNYSEDLEICLFNELSGNIRKGLPTYPKLEILIKEHLEKILKNKLLN